MFVRFVQMSPYLVIRGDLVVLLVQAEQTEYLGLYVEQSHVETNHLCVNMSYCINSEIFTCVG